MIQEILIGDLIMPFINEDSERDDRDCDTMFSYRESCGVASIRRAEDDSFIPKESIMLFDMNQMTPLEQEILIAIFEGRRNA
jgi:hypothetical protein